MIKIRLIVVLFLILSIFSLAGCHKAKVLEKFSVPETFDTTKEYNLTFWSKNDTDIVQKNLYESAIDRFENIYPNIHITMKAYTNYQDLYQDVITNISTNSTPNICITYPDHVATYLEGNNIVVPLDGLMEDEKYGFGGSEVKFDSITTNEIVPEYLEECIYKDSYYLLPFMRSTEVCYINKTYVEKLGYTVPDVLTWDFIFEVSNKAMEKNDGGSFKVNDQKVMIPFIYKSTDNMMIQMLKQKNIPYSSDQSEIFIFNDSTKDILKRLNEEGAKKVFSTFKISSYPGNYFNKGQCIFAVDSTAGSTWMGTNASKLDIDKTEIADFETVVRMVPQYDVDNPLMISQGPSLCIFNKEDKNEVLASWLFMMYLLDNDIQINYSKTEGYVPVTLRAQNSDEYKEYLSKSGENNDEYYYVKIDSVKILLKNVDKTFITSVFNGSASLREAAGELIEEAVKAGRRKIDLNYDELYEKIKSLYRLNEIEKDETTGSIKKKGYFGPLPTGSIILIMSIIAGWALIFYLYLERTNYKIIKWLINLFKNNKEKK